MSDDLEHTPRRGLHTIPKSLQIMAHLPPISFSEECEEMYQSIQTKLEKKHFGKYVAINISTKKYVVGPTLLDVADKYRAKFGNVPGWCRGIGFLDRV